MAFVKTDEKKEDKDAAPKATTPEDAAKGKAKADAKPKKSPKKSKPGPKDLEAKLSEMVVGGGMALISMGRIDDGIILYTRGEALAHSWSEVAKVNESVDRVLRRLVEGGVWSGVIITTASVAMPIVQNHGIMTGVPNPFSVAQSEIDALPEEVKFIVQMHVDARKKAAEEAQEAATKVSPISNAHDPA